MTSLTYLDSRGLMATSVPRGFITDLASIPRILHSLIPVNGRHSPAAIVHDYLYATQRCTRKQADETFLWAMESLGVNAVRRYAMYAGVRAFGWLVWAERKTDMTTNPDAYRRINGLA